MNKQIIVIEPCKVHTIREEDFCRSICNKLNDDENFNKYFECTDNILNVKLFDVSLVIGIEFSLGYQTIEYDIANDQSEKFAEYLKQFLNPEDLKTVKAEKHFQFLEKLKVSKSFDLRFPKLILCIRDDSFDKEKIIDTIKHLAQLLNSFYSLQRIVKSYEPYLEPKSLFAEYETILNRSLTDEERKAIDNLLNNRADSEDITIYINSIKELSEKQNCLENQEEITMYETNDNETYERNIRIFFDEDKGRFVVKINEDDIEFSASDFNNVRSFLNSYIEDLEI